MTLTPERYQASIAATAVDRSLPLPAWAQVERDLRSVIDRGTLTIGARLPPEHELSGLYGVSRITIRQALTALSRDGYIERRQGSGTFVADRPLPVQHDLGLTTPWRDRFRAAGHRVESIVLTPSTLEDEPYELFRELTTDERGLARLHLKRLHTVDGKAIGITDSWLAGAARDVLIQQPLQDASVSKTLEAAGVVARRIDHSLEVGKVTSTEAALLDCPTDAGVLIDWSVWRRGGELLETSRTIWLGSRVRLNYVNTVDETAVNPTGTVRRPS